MIEPSGFDRGNRPWAAHCREIVVALNTKQWQKPTTLP